jgi:hypothetical protein
MSKTVIVTYDVMHVSERDFLMNYI